MSTRRCDGCGEQKATTARTPYGWLCIPCNNASKPVASYERLKNENSQLYRHVDALERRIKALEAERGPGLKAEPELVIALDCDWD